MSGGIYIKRTKRIKRIKNELNNVFFPVVFCGLCGAKTSRDYLGICNFCLKELRDLEDKYALCDFCGNFYLRHFSSCPQCFHKKTPRSYKKVTACFGYEGVAKDLVHLLKFRNGRYLAEPMAKLISEKGDISENRKYTVVIPVPLSPKREKERGYNQSLLLAEELGEYMDIPVEKKFLIKVKDTLAQSTLKGERRCGNMDQVFSTTSNRSIQGKCVLLVDDVITTGTTANACAKVLKKAGAKTVKIVAFCGSTKGD